ncbi:MAG: hypothetical protein KAH32_07855 [Chlamydiia bacterium]|nr:hypothetical protein [Chlamydiia bacterium]
MTKDLLDQVELLKGLKADQEFGTVVTLQDVQDVLGTTKMITHSAKGMYFKYADVKGYGGENGNRKSFYIYFRDSKFRKLSISLTEIRSCTVENEKGVELAFIPFLEERIRDGKNFPEGLVVLSTTETDDDKKAYPLAYYVGYTQDSWQAHRKVGLIAKKSSETIRAEYISGREVTKKYKSFPFLKSVKFQVVGS